MYVEKDRRDRVISITAVVAIHLALGYALIVGLGVTMPSAVSRSIALFDVPPPPPPRVDQVPAPRKVAHHAAPASAANLRAHASPVVAPLPVIVTLPPPIIAAAKVADGAAASSGAANHIGPGSGSGGQGDGTGAGGMGDGDGGGTDLEQIAGRIRDADDPRPRDAQGLATVHIRFTVAASGRVTACGVTGSSGDAVLDTLTCRLIEKRFRYRPSRDAAGRAIADTVDGEQVWGDRGGG